VIHYGKSLKLRSYRCAFKVVCMALKHTFKILTRAPANVITTVISNIGFFIPLWASYEDLLLKSEREGIVRIRLGEFSFSLSTKVNLTKRGNEDVIVLEGRNGIHLSITFMVRQKKDCSEVNCEVLVRAGFFREIKLSRYFKEFVNSLKGSLFEFLRTISEGKGFRFEGKELGQEFLNPRLLEDNIVLSSILTRSRLKESFNLSFNGFKILNMLEQLGARYREGVKYLSIKSMVNIKVLLVNGKIKGFRIDSGNSALNGREALAYVMNLGEVKGRCYVFDVPKSVV